MSTLGLRGALLLALVTFHGAAPARTAAQGTVVLADNATLLYDNFTATTLSSTKWGGDQPQGGMGSGLELTRRVVSGALTLSHRVTGGTTTNTGQHYSANRVFFKRSVTSTDMKFDVTPKAYTLNACTATGAALSWVAVRGSMVLFNDGTANGDVTAFISLERSSRSTAAAGTLEAVAYLAHATRGTIGRVVLGSVTNSTKATLRLRWDAVANTVEYQMNTGPAQYLSYTGSDTTKRTVRTLEVVGWGPNCTAGAKTVSVEAAFDNVYVNP